MKRYLYLWVAALLTQANAAPWGQLFYNETVRQQNTAPTALPLPPARLSAETRADRQHRHWINGQASAAVPHGLRVGEPWQH